MHLCLVRHLSQAARKMPVVSASERTRFGGQTSCCQTKGATLALSARSLVRWSQVATVAASAERSNPLEALVQALVQALAPVQKGGTMTIT